MTKKDKPTKSPKVDRPTRAPRPREKRPGPDIQRAVEAPKPPTVGDKGKKKPN